MDMNAPMNSVNGAMIPRMIPMIPKIRPLFCAVATMDRMNPTMPGAADNMRPVIGANSWLACASVRCEVSGVRPVPTQSVPKRLK